MTPTTTIRLTDTDRQNAQQLIKAGLATTVTGAIQASLALVARKIVR